MHVDTGHNFPEVIEFRDRAVDGGRRPPGGGVGAGVDRRRPGGRGDAGHGPRATGCRPRRCSTPSSTTGSTPCSGAPAATRRRPGPRSGCSPSATSSASGIPKNQRPELWSLYNGRHHNGEHIRVFPLSNWTELDIWQYIAEEEIELPSIYYAHRREVFRRDGMLLAVSPFVTMMDDEDAFEMVVRYRTVGDASCTGAVESTAATVADVIAEVAATRVTERGATRADDRTSEAAMEDRKREGYF